MRVLKCKSLLSLVLCLAVAPMGKSFAQPAAGARAFVNPSQVYVSSNRLFATARVTGAQVGQTVNIYLRGKGAPAQPLTGQANSTGTYVCAGTKLDNKGGKELDNGCSFPSAGLSKGSYSIEVECGGKILERHAFSLVDVPVGGGKMALDVDPVPRANRAYMHYQGFEVWVPIDARHRGRLITLSWFRNGSFVRSDERIDQRIVDGPNLAHDDTPAVAVVPVLVPLAHVNGSGGDEIVDGSWRVVVVGGDDRVYGSWSFTWGPDGSFPALGPLTKDSDIPAPILALAKKPAVELLARYRKRAIGGEHRALAGYPEPVVCAAFSNATAKQKLISLAQVQSEITHSGWRYSDADDVANSSTSTAAEKANARRTKAASAKNTTGAAAVVDRLRNEVSAASRTFQNGCLPRVVPTLSSLIQ